MTKFEKYIKRRSDLDFCDRGGEEERRNCVFYVVVGFLLYIHCKCNVSQGLFRPSQIIGAEYHNREIIREDEMFLPKTYHWWLA